MARPSWANRPVGVPSCRSALPRRHAVRRPAPTSPWYVRVLGSTNARHVREFPYILWMKRVCKYKKRQSTSQHPRTKSSHRPADKPRMHRAAPVVNQSSTARQPLVVFPDPVDIGFRLFLLSQTRRGQLSCWADRNSNCLVVARIGIGVAENILGSATVRNK